ncbi:MAG: PilX N-terminal domain-containing pilus assembly protein [Halopseudomonas sabulinigri]
MSNGSERRQRGAALLVSLVFLLLMSLAAVAGVRSATSQERMVANLQQRSLGFQSAEAGLRWLEQQIRQNALRLPAERCEQPICVAATGHALSVAWKALPAIAREQLQSGNVQLWYRIERIGTSVMPRRVTVSSPSTLYRLSVLSLNGNSRTVLEATYAHTRL